jgi:hypothetical protein
MGAKALAAGQSRSAARTPREDGLHHFSKPAVVFLSYLIDAPSFPLSSCNMFRPTLRSSVRLVSRSTAPSFLAGRLTAYRYLSQEARTKIDQAVKANPVVLFMKGTPVAPQCGFSRAVVQVLELHGVPEEKLKTYNVLADEELRSGIKEYSYVFGSTANASAVAELLVRASQ